MWCRCVAQVLYLCILLPITIHLLLHESYTISFLAAFTHTRTHTHTHSAHRRRSVVSLQHWQTPHTSSSSTPYSPTHTVLHQTSSFYLTALVSLLCLVYFDNSIKRFLRYTASSISIHTIFSHWILFFKFFFLLSDYF